MRRSLASVAALAAFVTVLAPAIALAAAPHHGGGGYAPRPSYQSPRAVYGQRPHVHFQRPGFNVPQVQRTNYARPQYRPSYQQTYHRGEFRQRYATGLNFQRRYRRSFYPALYSNQIYSSGVYSTGPSYPYQDDYAQPAYSPLYEPQIYPQPAYVQEPAYSQQFYQQPVYQTQVYQPPAAIYAPPVYSHGCGCR